MQITLNQVEIEAALIAYVSSQGVNVCDKQTTVTTVAGRGGNGMSATLDINASTGGSPSAVSQVELEPAPEVEPAVEEEPIQDAVEEDETEVTPANSTSLFNKPAAE